MHTRVTLLICKIILPITLISKLTHFILEYSKMAALSHTCVLRNAMRILASKSQNRELLNNRWITSPQKNVQHYTRKCQVMQLSTCNVLLVEKKQPSNTGSLLDDSPAAHSPSSSGSGSTLPLGVLLKQAEEKVKEKQEDDQKRKKERKEKFARYQKWAMGITGAMLGGSALLTLYELGE